jgi:chemotaxis protein MotB
MIGASVFKQGLIEIEQIEHGFKEEKTLGLVRVLPTQGGIKISLQDRLFFKEGSCQIQIGGEKTLDKIAGLFSGMDNKVIIEAHIDNTKSKGYPSNWELSSKRAIAIFEHLTDDAKKRGFSEREYKKRFRVSGFADTRLAIPSNPSSPKNNRIDIVILED